MIVMWWHVVDTHPLLLGPVEIVEFEIECKSCGEHFLVGSLEKVPDTCPECWHSNAEVQL